MHASPGSQPSSSARDAPSYANVAVGERATHASPLPGDGSTPRGPQRRSVGAIVGSFTAAVTKHANAALDRPPRPLWQRSFCEHVVRNDRELERFRTYVEANPAAWNGDGHHPDNPTRW